MPHYLYLHIPTKKNQKKITLENINFFVYPIIQVCLSLMKKQGKNCIIFGICILINTFLYLPTYLNLLEVKIATKSYYLPCYKVIKLYYFSTYNATIENLIPKIIYRSPEQRQSVTSCGDIIAQ